MKKNLSYCLFALLGLGASIAFAACSSDDDEKEKEEPEVVEPVDPEAIGGHWYVEIPRTGDVVNWRSEVLEMTTYDHIGVILYVNSYDGEGYWAHLYFKDGEIINYSGFGKDQEGGEFKYTMDDAGNISISRLMPNTPPFENFKYADGQIVAMMDGQTVTFAHPVGEKEAMLEDFWELLVEEGLIGYGDDDTSIDTDISDKPAAEPSRAPRVIK